MKHYTLDRWVDFTRGIAKAEDAIVMQNHLVGGCTKCQREAEFSTQLTGACQRLASQQVPDSAVRLARAIFPIRVTDRPKRGTFLPIELIYDSFLVPAPAGLRATWQVGWQGLYRAGDCSVDLRIEPELKTTRASVIGQVTNHLSPNVEMGNLQVCLRSGKMVVAETISNRFGEFQMEYDQQSQLKLCIYLQGGSKSIQVPLKRFTSEKPASPVARKKRSAMAKE